MEGAIYYGGLECLGLFIAKAEISTLTKQELYIKCFDFFILNLYNCIRESRGNTNWKEKTKSLFGSCKASRVKKNIRA